MDRHKFRVWDGKNLHNDASIDGDGTVHIASKRGFHTFNTIISRCTGRKDENNKLVFEGDIVKCVNGHKGIIEWEEHDCCFNVNGYYETSDDYPSMAFMEGQPFEIIGNIYQNPDLLNV